MPAFDLESVSRSALVDDRGRSYAEFRRELRPRWPRVAGDLALAFVAMIATGWLVAQSVGEAWILIGTAVAVGALSFGYWMAYLQLFIHEAAHFNLMPDRHWNDRVANLLIGSWVGTNIASYREIHWTHHRRHGEPDDSEHSYFSCLNARFVFETLFGVRALRVVLFRREKLESRRAAAAAPLVAGAILHLTVVAGFFALGYWPVSLAWVLGMGMFFPFFGALRQLLEHRGEDARACVDYTKVPHGRTTRLFHGGPFAGTFGAAGFTRHLIHHWDSSVSYTNLAEVERFLSCCEPTKAISASKTTYFRAIRALYAR